MTTSTTNQEGQAEQIAKWEELFAQRYTDKDDEFIEMNKKDYTPPVVDDWDDLPPRSFEQQRRNGPSRFSNDRNRYGHSNDGNRNPRRNEQDRSRSNDGNGYAHPNDRSRSPRRNEHDRSHSNDQRYDQHRHRNFHQRDRFHQNNHRHDRR